MLIIGDYPHRLNQVTDGSNLEALSDEIDDLAKKESKLNVELNNATKSSAIKNKIKSLEDQVRPSMMTCMLDI